LRGIQQHLNELQQAGVKVVAISVDSPEESRKLAEKAGFTFDILSDPNLGVIRSYDLVHARAGEHGRDISRPAEFLVDSSGTVRWVNLTEDYRVRARAEQILAAAATLH